MYYVKSNNGYNIMSYIVCIVSICYVVCNTLHNILQERFPGCYIYIILLTSFLILVCINVHGNNLSNVNAYILYILKTQTRKDNTLNVYIYTLYYKRHVVTLQLFVVLSCC